MNHAKTLQDVSNNIRTVLGLEFQYKVPLYQRRYVWEEANWEKLWSDILHQKSLGFDTSGHFTGPIVTLPIAGEQNQFEVIDGQQRLTTFQIIFCVIRDLWSTDSGLKEVSERNVKFGDVHKFVPTHYDKDTFKKVVEGEYGAAIFDCAAFDANKGTLVPKRKEEARLKVFGEGRISPNILDAYDHFYEKIKTHLNEDRKQALILNNILESSFKLIHLTLGTPEQAERIFESINATGRMLSNFDYIRNHLFLRARELGINPEGKLYRDIYYGLYWKFENTSNYWVPTKLKEFFRTFLMAVWNPHLEEENDKLFEEYRAYSEDLIPKFSTNKDRIKHEFEQLSSYAKSYRQLIDADSTSEVGEHRQFYKDLGIPSLDPFLLFVKHNYPCELTGLRGVCAILESYIVRRMFVEGSTKDSHEDIIEDSYTCIKGFFREAIKGPPFSAKTLAESLKSKWPDDSRVQDAFTESDSKDPNLIRYIFHRMETFREEIENYNWSFPSLGKELELSEKMQEILNNQGVDGFSISDFNDLWQYPEFFTISSV